MNPSALILLILVLTFVIAIVALGMLAVSKRLKRQSGLPGGEIVYEDASGSAREPLFSRHLGLAGKPDYLLKNQDGSLIPVEVKSGFAPSGDQPHDSHLLQLAAYFFLIEDVLKCQTQYGLIRYRNRTLQIPNSEELRRKLMDTIAQMRTLLARAANLTETTIKLSDVAAAQWLMPVTNASSELPPVLPRRALTTVLVIALIVRPR